LNVSAYIARRYFFSRQNKNAVNIITGISLLGLVVGTAALIVVLSAMNGLEGLVRSFYNDFDPDIKISLNEGKYFSAGDAHFQELVDVEGVEAVAQVLEERAILNFRDKEHIVSLKGVDGRFSTVSRIEVALRNGAYTLGDSSDQQILMGTGVAYYLGYSRIDLGEPLSAFVLQANASASNFSNAFSSASLTPTGIFSVQAEFDAKYALISLPYLQRLLQRPGALTQLEVKLKNYAEVERVEEQISALLGDTFKVQNRDEQQEVFYKVMKSEGLFAYLVFALILTIATFTIMGSIAMMMLDKRRDLRTLWALGLSVKQLRKLFFLVGMRIGGGGALIGLIFGCGLVLLQQYYGLISVGDGYLIEYYPVALKWQDMLLVSATVMGLSSLTAYLSARRLGLSLLR
jgi:lipoprotein-releasing system permease protein